MAILTEEDLRFFDEQGYVVVREVVPKENCDAVIDAIWEFLGLNRDNLEDCYREPLKPGGMIEMYQHPAECGTTASTRDYTRRSPKCSGRRIWLSALTAWA